MTTKIAYQLDAAGNLIGDTLADESPLEAGVYLVPAGCTLIAPPSTIPDGKWPRFNGTTWDMVAKPPHPAEDPVAKLQAFLEQNKDVAELLKGTLVN